MNNKFVDCEQRVLHVNNTMPLNIYIFNLADKIDAPTLVGKIYEFKNKYPKSMSTYLKDKTNVNAWHSDYFTHKLTDIFNDLLNIQIDKIKQINQFEPIAKIKNVWVNIYQKGDNTKRHMHGLHNISSVYYPYVEKPATPIIFDDNNQKNLKKYEIEPKTNMLILFHSAIFHTVPKVVENKRISISSNFYVESLNSKTNIEY